METRTQFEIERDHKEGMAICISLGLIIVGLVFIALCIIEGTGIEEIGIFKVLFAGISLIGVGVFGLLINIKEQLHRERKKMQKQQPHYY